MSGNFRNRCFELLRKCRSWIDCDAYFPPIFRQKSDGDAFKEKILECLTETLQKECFHVTKNQILIPTNYKIFISRADDAEFFGVKRDALLRILNGYIANCLKMLSIETAVSRFVQLVPTPELEQGMVKIVHQWEDDLPVNINFEASAQHFTAPPYEDDFDETTVITSFSETGGEYFEAECETIVNHHLPRLFSLEIWYEGVRQDNLPIYKPVISVGRKSRQTPVDIELQGSEISRPHAVLQIIEKDYFLLQVVGRNPVFVGGTPIFQGQTVSCAVNEVISIGNYVLKPQNDLQFQTA